MLRFVSIKQILLPLLVPSLIFLGVLLGLATFHNPKNRGVPSQPPAAARPSGEQVAPLQALHSVPAPQIDASAQRQHEVDVYAELWNVCKAKHLKYQIACDDKYGCNGYAWDGRLDWIDKIDYYESHSEPPSNPTEAAEQLVSILKGQPNEHEHHAEYVRPKNTFDTGEVRP